MAASLLHWKPEPLSPQLSEESWISDEAALYWTTLEQSTSSEEELESKADVASKLLDDLDNLNDLDDLIKEEPFVNWLEDKLPIFEDVHPTPIVPISAHVKSEQKGTALASDTQALLQEFENVFDAVEMTHGTLTPPQSPQYKTHLTNLEPIKNQATPFNNESQLPSPEPDKIIIPSLIYSPSATVLSVTYDNTAIPQADVDHELAVVEELVRTRVQDMVHSPCSPGSNSSTFDDSSSDDPEWIPSISQQVVPQLNSKSRDIRKYKPYSRITLEDKRSRKKEQNKNAATRYRLKKKAEVEEILEEEKKLIENNEHLENQIVDLKREIKYLKGLMRELFKAKGVLN